MPTYAITPRGLKRWERIDPIVSEGRGSFDTFNEHLILQRLVEGPESFYFPAATSLANAVEKLERMNRIQQVQQIQEDLLGEEVPNELHMTPFDNQGEKIILRK